MVPNEDFTPDREESPAPETPAAKPDPRHEAPGGGALAGLAGFGVSMMLVVFLAWLVRAEWTWPLLAGLVIGVLSIVAWLVVRWPAVAAFLAAYWLAIYVVLAAVAALWLSDSQVEAIPVIGKLPFIIARPTLTFLLVLAGMIPFRILGRRDPQTAERAGVAANVAILLVAGTWVLVLVNSFGSGLLSRELGTIDTTETGVYSLGDKTRGLLAELDEFPEPVYATYMDFGTNYMASAMGQEPLGDRGKDFLEQYGNLSQRLVVKVLDAVRDKAEAEEYLRKLGIDDTDIGVEDTVIFTYRPEGEDEPNRKDVAVNSWSFIERTQLGTAKFKGEQLFTSAIQDVLFERRKVYFLEGHGEHPLSGSQQATMARASELVRKLALEVDKFELSATGGVPEDADVIVMAGPRRSLLPEEVTALTTWLDAGGALVLLAEPQTQLRNPPGRRSDLGLEKYLKEKLGIDLKTDHQVMMYEVATGSSLATTLPTELLLSSEYSFHAIVEDLSRRRFPVRFVEAAPVIVEKPDGVEDLSVEELVYVRRAPQGAPDAQSYGARLYPMRDVFTQEQGDLRGVRISVAAAAEKELPDEGDEKRATRVVVFGDSDFATTFGLDERYQIYAPGNPTLFSNAVTWAAKRESLLSIDPKTLETETVALDDGEERLAKSLAIWGIPIFVLFFAIRMAIRRRR